MSVSESKKTKQPCKIIRQECIGTDIYSMWLDAGEIGKMQCRDSLYLFTAVMAANFFRGRSVSVRSIKKREN